MTQSTPTGIDIIQARDSGEAIGEKLRLARRNAEMSIADVSQVIRISKDFIKQLEAGDFDALPSPTYVSGYIRSYGLAVGMEAEIVSGLVDDFYAQLEEGAATPTYKFPIGDQQPRRSGALLASIAVLLAVGVYTGWYLVDRPKTIENVLTENAQTAKVTPEIESTMTESGALEGGADARPDQITGLDDSMENDALLIVETVKSEAQLDGATDLPLIDGTRAEIAGVDDVGNDNLVNMPLAPAVNGVETLGVMVEADLPQSNNTDAAWSAGMQKELQTGLPLASEIQTAGVSTEDGGSLTQPEDDVSQELKPDQGSAIANQRDPENEVTLQALASSWVEIVRNDGEEVMTRLMRAGDTYLIDVSDSLYLSTGNAGGLQFLFNDGTVKEVGEIGEIVRDLPLVISGLKNKL